MNRQAHTWTCSYILHRLGAALYNRLTVFKSLRLRRAQLRYTPLPKAGPSACASCLGFRVMSAAFARWVGSASNCQCKMLSLTAPPNACVYGCRLTVPNREWPGLLEWLHQLSGSPSEHSRQAAIHILAALTEVIGTCKQRAAMLLCRNALTCGL